MTAEEKRRVGDELRPFVRTLTAAQIGSFASALGPVRHKRDQHTDPAIARMLGRPGIVAQGPHRSALVHEMLTLELGMSWMRGGSLDILYRKMVVADETITTRGRVTAVEPRAHSDRLTLEVWCENQHGDTTLSGTATAILPRSTP
jgi:acyl dehydratase